MIDLMLMKGLTDAIKPGTRLIMVGDSDQLPSVGAGNVLRDMIERAVSLRSPNSMKYIGRRRRA